MAPYERWAAFDDRPVDWLHHSALSRVRLANAERLFDFEQEKNIDDIERAFSFRRRVGWSSRRATIKRWLEALIEDTQSQKFATKMQAAYLTHGPASSLQNDASIRDSAKLEMLFVQASMAAIQTAALLPKSIREGADIGNIVLTADGNWVRPEPEAVQLSGGEVVNLVGLVHPLLETDRDTLGALKVLGLQPASPKTAFRAFASAMLKPPLAGNHKDGHDTPLDRGNDWHEFWRLARNVNQSEAAMTIESFQGWREALRVRTVEGSWSSLFVALLPGPIVPDDGSRDSDIAIDVKFHEEDISLLKRLNAVDVPRPDHELSQERARKFTAAKRKEFLEQDLPRSPQQHYLNFRESTTSGPLDVLERLSVKGKALFTWSLLGLHSTYTTWTLRHDTQDIYPLMKVESPALETLRQHGYIETERKIHKFSDGLGDPPRNRAVLRKLLSHPHADLIRETFGVSTEFDTPVEPIGEDDPIPLVDVWPELEPHLSAQCITLQLIRCDGLRKPKEATGESEIDCQVKDGFIYLTRRDDERNELCSVLQEIDLSLPTRYIEDILRRHPHARTIEARDAVRGCSTDDERLLSAVGEAELRRHLPESLISILEQSQGPLTELKVAQAAIATFHTGALREYRHALDHLDPPKKWAGSQRAVDFVRSLGFGEEWAGERNTRRDPFIEVEGPYSLPKLHGYQQKIVENVRGLIRSSGDVDERRGMISMPTGSGKTRVAVQSIVEAIRDDGFKGGILWVADRDELCEQAVEAWRQVWASEGPQATQLRISRMWAGQPRPLPPFDMHVIVATIQTLSAKIARHPEQYGFLADFNLLVFDEAHRSVAATYTSVMQELGLTRYRKAHEPYLIGLTATPYRGHDQEETRRLVNRYSRNRLDTDAFRSDEPESVIQELQFLGILAQADQEIIPGSRLLLSGDELRQAKQTPWLPQSVENRLADDISRTQRIIEAYKTHILRSDSNWPTLIFATSVEHSQTVAALLTTLGVQARAVSATTNTSSRRRIVEEFRSGEIKVLVNYGIFREGFDAPKTRAIIVARPVYSPNLYFQMIGRGLRGVKNGGNDRCLILNVEDNIANFQQKLAFSDLDWLWA